MHIGKNEVAMHPNLKLEYAYALVRVAGSIAVHCDRSEHNEDVSKETLRTQGSLLRDLAAGIAADNDLDLVELYASRLEGLETRHPIGGAGLFDGGGAARAIKSWSDAQQVQYKHDIYYHPDVTGMPKFSQIRHYAFHLSKLAMLTLEAALEDSNPKGSQLRDEFMTNRLVDILIFGIKLATVTGERLSSGPFLQPVTRLSGDVDTLNSSGIFVS
jgi:hypothetical protein